MTAARGGRESQRDPLPPSGAGHQEEGHGDDRGEGRGGEGGDGRPGGHGLDGAVGRAVRDDRAPDEAGQAGPATGPGSWTAT